MTSQPETVASAAKMPAPQFTLDPRFKMARALVVNGRAEDAVEVFATLLHQAISMHGEDHLETAPLYHEYGNALFRIYQHEQDRLAAEEADGEATENDTKDAENNDKKRSAAAAAAEKRLQSPSSATATESVAPSDDTNDTTKADAVQTPSEVHEDLALALEMLETAWAIYDAALADSSAESSLVSYQGFVIEQVPRVLTHLGEVLAECRRYADAVDAYLRALQCHENKLQQVLTQQTDGSLPSLDVLICRRKVTEDNILIAETILACPSNEALVTTESKTVLVPAGERISFAKSYYEFAQSQLEESMVVLGQLAAKNLDIGEEKENVCFASTLLMGVGVTLNELDELPALEPSTKKFKTK